MSIPFIELDWHSICARHILNTDQKAGVMVLRGRPKSGKGRFLVNFGLADRAGQDTINQTVFRCPPCGTEREILVRLARKIGIEECRDGDPRSELFVIEKIAERLGSGRSTLIINDAEEMSASLLRSIVGLRRMVGDLGGTLALVFGTTYSPNHLLSRGLSEEEVSCVFEIPDLSGLEILGCLREFCPVESKGLLARYETGDTETFRLVQELGSRNLSSIGFIVEFVWNLLQSFRGIEVGEVEVRKILRDMENECREMIRPVGGQSERQAMLFGTES